MQNIDQPKNSKAPQVFYKTALFKTISAGLIWALGFSILISFGNVEPQDYLLLIASIPASLIFTQFNFENFFSLFAVSMINLAIYALPYIYYRAFNNQHWWFYLSISIYAFLNAALGFSMIITLKGMAH
jgi:hypothetical protein